MDGPGKCYFNGVTQTQKDKYYMISLIRVSLFRMSQCMYK